jgi:ribosomal protein S25
MAEKPEDNLGEAEKPVVPQKIKNMHIVVPDQLHTRVRMMCVIKDITLREFTNQALVEKLERDEKDLPR